MYSVLFAFRGWNGNAHASFSILCGSGSWLRVDLLVLKGVGKEYIFVIGC